MTDEELIHAYVEEEYSTTELARATGCSSTRIGERLVALGIPRRGIGSLTEKQKARGTKLGGDAGRFEDRHDEFIARLLKERPWGHIGHWSFDPGGARYVPPVVGAR